MPLWVAVIYALALDQIPNPTPRVQVTDSSVRSAVIRAKERLNRLECQRVLTDFQDQEGRYLIENLGVSSLTAGEYLLERIWFVDSGDTLQCRRDGIVAAFTAPGHKVVQVCTNRFAQGFERQPVAAEIIIIHEMLHTLGLGENPPSSRAITAQVTKRCGGS